jgi:hypothetical protein
MRVSLPHRETRPAPRRREDWTIPETAMLKFLLWILLFVLCWPLALLALVLYPLVWVLLLPFRLLGITVDAVFELLKALLLLPSRVLGGRPA